MAGTSSATLTAAPPTSGTYRFDPATSSWSALAPLHDPRTAAIAVVMHDRIHIVGGKDRSGARLVMTCSTVTNSWSLAAPMPTARDHTA